MRLLLDTCVLSELQKPARSGAVAAFIDGQPDHLLHISVITLGEIAKGIALLPDGRKKQSLEKWRATLAAQFEDRILPLDHEAAELWGELTAAGQKRGISIPAADGQIAATAIRHGLHVVTRNTPHFEAAGAMIVNPWFSPVASGRT
jgi:predicted nucleic acid-binding protein